MGLVDEYNAETPNGGLLNGLMWQYLYPILDHMSQKSREKGVPLTPEQVAWDQMMQRSRDTMAPWGPLNPMSKYVDGRPVHNPNPSPLPPGWIGVRN